MSTIFDGLEFYFIPNNSSTITKIRKNLALKHGAQVLENSIKPSTYLLVDKKVYPTNNQIVKLVNELEGDKAELSVLEQTWLVDSIANKTLLHPDRYKISLDLDRSPRPKKRKIQIQKFKEEDLVNKPAILNNPNSETMSLLEQMAKQSSIQGDNKFKAQAYRTAIDTLSKTAQMIDSYEKARRLPGIGESIALKIQEINDTSKIRALEQLENSNRNKQLELFKGIYSVGDVAAKRFINEGMKTLDDVSRRSDLTVNQKWGLKYYTDWNTRIPRDEIEIHEIFVKKLLKQIDPNVELLVGGSYRRGSLTSNDIDFILTKKDVNDITVLKEITQKLLKKMSEAGYLKCSLTALTFKWHGGCKLPLSSSSYMSKLPSTSKDIRDLDEPKCRRVDFLLVPYDSKGAAFIYFTGNDAFNKLMRKRAKDRGMILNESGLYRKPANEENCQEPTLELVEGFEEKKIFKLLDVEWREPKDRNIGNFSI